MNLKKIVENILAIKGFKIGQNIAITEGNNNITIQDITNSSIRITQSINGVDVETFITKIISKIVEVYPSHKSKTPKILNSILFASPKRIIGRTKEVGEIMYRLNTNNSLLLVSGVGGIGKSVLANYYYSLFEDIYSHIIWLTGKKDLEEALLFDVRLLKNLGLTDKLLPILPSILNSKNDLQREYAVAEVESALKKLPAKTLVIIDDANTDNFKTIQRWQSTFENFHFLITSREVNSNLNTYELGVLSEDDALELFYTFYGYEKDDSTVKSILEQIQYHTLLIELIAKAGEEGALPLKVLHNFLETGYIEHEGLQFAIDINELKENNRLPEEERIVNYIQILFKTILKLDEDEQEVLSSLSILPTTPHSKGLLFKILKELKKKDSRAFESIEILNSLNSLHKKGYLARDKGIYSLHSLVASATRGHIKIDLTSKEQLIINVKNLLHFAPNEGNPVDKFPFVPFGDALLKYLPLPDGEANVKSYTSLQNELGRVHRVFGNYKRSINIMEGGINLLERYGDKSKKTKSILTDRMTNLSLAYSGIGDNHKAKELLEEVINRDVDLFDMIHPGMVSNLSVICRDLGEYKQAVELSTFALNQSQSMFGETDLHTAHSLFNLGMCYKDLGDYGKALKLTTEASNLFERKLGVQHVKVIDTLLGVSMVHAELGDFKESSQILERVLENCINLFGEDHPKVYNIKNSLAINYGDFGKYEKAVEILEDVLYYQTQHLGEDHPNLLVGQSNLSIYYEKAGNYEKAAEIAEISLKKSISKFGIDNPIIATRMTNLAVVYKQLGKLDNAIKMFKTAIEIDAKHLGENNIKTAVTLNGLGTTYGELQDFENALDCLSRSLKIKMEVLEENHPDIGITQSNLSDIYLALKDFSKSKALIEASLKNGIHNFGENHPAIPKRLTKLSTIYYQIGKPQEAIDIIDKAIVLQKKLLGENHPEVAQLYVILGSMFGGYKQFDEAENFFQKSYSILSSQLGEENYHTQNVIKLFHQLQIAKKDYEKAQNSTTKIFLYTDKAYVFQSNGDFIKAKELYEKEVEQLIRRFGESHIYTAEAYINLSTVYHDLKMYREAISFCGKGYDIYLAQLGKDHPKTFETEFLLGSLQMNIAADMMLNYPEQKHSKNNNLAPITIEYLENLVSSTHDKKLTLLEKMNFQPSGFNDKNPISDFHYHSFVRSYEAKESQFGNVREEIRLHQGSQSFTSSSDASLNDGNLSTISFVLSVMDKDELKRYQSYYEKKFPEFLFDGKYKPDLENQGEFIKEVEKFKVFKLSDSVGETKAGTLEFAIYLSYVNLMAFAADFMDKAK